MKCSCEKTRCFEWEKRVKRMVNDGNVPNGMGKGSTHDCAADLVPLALPPDFPPVILMKLGGWVSLGDVFEVVRWLRAVRE